jgi:hypothetical protein
MPVRHDVQQRRHRRAGIRDAAVVEVSARAALLRFHQVVDAVGEHRRVLPLGLQDRVGEHAVRAVEHAAEVGAHEGARDAVAEAAGAHRAALEHEVVHLLRWMGRARDSADKRDERRRTTRGPLAPLTRSRAPAAAASLAARAPKQT